MAFPNADSSRSRRSLGGLLVAGGLIGLLAASACVNNNGSLLILGVLAPPVTATTSGCVYTANADGPYISYGTMDVAFEEQYTPALLLANQMVARGDPTQNKVESNKIIIQGTIVRITDAGGADLTSYTILGTGFVEAATSGTPGLGTFQTTLVDPATADSIRASLSGSPLGSSKRLISYMKVFGTTTGGTHIESAEVSFPVDACVGCLVTFPATAQDPAQPLPNCLGGASTGATINSPCVMGQDQAIDCRLCQNNPVCIP